MQSWSSQSIIPSASLSIQSEQRSLVFSPAPPAWHTGSRKQSESAQSTSPSPSSSTRPVQLVSRAAGVAAGGVAGV
jgi:hypothetical protein